MSSSIHEIYALLNLVVFSANMSAKQKDGEWKKEFSFTPGWQNKTTLDYDKTKSGYALITGKANGITAIDIDDPTTPHNKKLMELMEDCTMIQQTKKGFHYVFKYAECIKGVSEHKLALDTRNDNNCIFCEPSIARKPFGDIVAEYKWIKLPESKDELIDIPDEVLQYLAELSPKYIKEGYLEDEVAETESVSSDSIQSNPKPIESPVVSDDKDIILRLADCITNNDDRTDWINNGLICFNEGLPLSVWEMMSKKSRGYEAGECAKQWATFKTDNRSKVTQASWWRWIKLNNKAKYNELMEERNDFLHKIELLNNNDIAKFFWNIHPNAYVWNKDLGWFILNQYNSWDKCDSAKPEKLKNHIADTLQELCKETKKACLLRYAKLSATITDGDKQKSITKAHAAQMKLLDKAYVALGSSVFCNGVIDFLTERYTVDDLDSIMDSNSNLFAFNNGFVYDLKAGVSRKIVPTDYISLTTGYAMPTSSNPTIRESINKFLYGLFENEETKDYLLNVLSTCLYGGNIFEEFYIFTGTGGNGKGVVSDLLKSTFGDYFYSVSATLFTKASERIDQPLPALVDAMGKRIMLTSEAESDAVLQEELLKKMTGGDIIEARRLNKNKIWRARASYKPIFLMNEIPKPKVLSEAMKRRQRVIDFPFQFRPVISGANDRLGNPDIKNIVAKGEWKMEFIQMLFEKYNTIKNLKSLPQANAVIEATEQHFNTHNPYKYWLEEYFVMTKAPADRLSARELESLYIEHNNTKPESKAFSQALIFNGLIKKAVNGRIFYCGLKKKLDIQEDS